MLRGVGRHALPAAVAAVFLLPLWFLVAGSLRPAGAPARGAELLPRAPTLDAYRELPRLVPLGDHLLSSAVVVALAVPLTVLVASWAGWGIRLLPRRGRVWAVGACLALMTVPASALWATRFEVYRVTGLLGDLGALVAPALVATTPFYVLVYVWSFAGIADAQIDAARMEGASARRSWWTLGMPQVRPATLAVAVLAFAVHWGGFLDALLYLRGGDDATLALGLQTLLLLGPTDFPVLLAGSVVLAVPPVVVLLLGQRAFLDDRVRLPGRRA